MKIVTTILFLFLATSSFEQQFSPKQEVYKILGAHNIFNPDYIITAKGAFENYVSTNPENPYRLIGMYWLAEIFKQLNKKGSAITRISQDKIKGLLR